MPHHRKLFDRELMVLLSVSAGLLLAWTLGVPIFEAPDEPHHWQYVTFVHQYGTLPYYEFGFFEANQPPIYYWMIAPLAWNDETPRDLGTRDEMGNPIPSRSVNFFEHSLADFKRFWSIRIARLATAGLAWFAVVVTFWIGQAATGKSETGLLAAGLLAFLPQFTFRGMNISNDTLVTLTSALGIFWIVRVIRLGYSRTRGYHGAIALGLALLSKLNALSLPVMWVGSVMIEPNPLLARVRRLGMLGIGLLVVAPWLIYNQIVYGSPLIENRMPLVVPFLIDNKPITSPYFVTLFPALTIRSLIGGFGWMNLWLPEWLYWAWVLLVGASGLGVARLIRMCALDGRLIIILAGMPLINLGLLIYLNTFMTQPQGRYFFPTLPAMVTLIAIGLQGLPQWSVRASRLVLLGAALLNVGVLIFVVLPTYWMH